MSLSSLLDRNLRGHPLLRKYTSLFREDLSATYSRDIQKWLVVGPLIGIVTGLLITGLTELVLSTIWARLLPFYIAHHWSIVPGLVIGFVLTGLIMQFKTPDPDEHSTEEVIRSYHEHHGDIAMKPFWWKMLASVTTVGCGGSAALEGPSIYGGGTVGSWLWTKLKRFGLDNRDQRLMLISGAAAGLAAVFKAPLTGLVFALEVPYKDDLAHEALLPSLIASVVAYATLVAIVGAEPIFAFSGSTSFRAIDLAWSAILGLGLGIIVMIFTITYRRFRSMFVHLAIPHTLKLLIGGFMTAICGLIFIGIFPGELTPLGPNYGAARMVLSHPYPPGEMLIFAIVKLFATLFSLGTGGVSAMFVPLFLSGGAFGSAFAQAAVHTSEFDLYAAVGMAAFLGAGYKTPLAAVVFVAETTGGHAYVIPSIIGVACAYAVSGEASASTEQRVRETVKFSSMSGIHVRDVMQRNVIMVQADTTLRNFADSIASHHQHSVFPVSENGKFIGTIAVWSLSTVPPEKWDETRVGELANTNAPTVAGNCDVMEALRMLARRDLPQMLLVTAPDGTLEGIITKTDILRSFQPDRDDYVG